MRVLSPLIFVFALAALSVALPHTRADDAAKIDPTARVEALAPSPATTKSTEQVDLIRADRLQDRRATLPGLLEQPTAAIADRRSPIEVTETREKKSFELTTAPIAMEPLAHQDSRYNGQPGPTRIQPGPDTLYRKSGMVDRYQQSIRDAYSTGRQSQVVLNQATTFDKFNRFVFRRNGPGTEDGPALVTPAGGASSVPPPSQDTSTQLKVIGISGSGALKNR
jgi:hypothetical protein